MGYTIGYEASEYGVFRDNKELKKFINDVLRTDVNQKNTCSRTRNNIYLIRKVDKLGSKLEYFCNVISLGARYELRKLVYSFLQDKELNTFYHDQASIEPNIPINECIEQFADIVEVQLPQLWEDNPSVKGDSNFFLESTIMMVLHVDYSEDGETYQYVIHRLYERQFNI